MKFELAEHPLSLHMDTSVEGLVLRVDPDMFVESQAQTIADVFSEAPSFRVPSVGVLQLILNNASNAVARDTRRGTVNTAIVHPDSEYRDLLATDMMVPGISLKQELYFDESIPVNEIFLTYWRMMENTTDPLKSVLDGGFYFKDGKYFVLKKENTLSDYKGYIAKVVI